MRLFHVTEVPPQPVAVPVAAPPVTRFGLSIIVTVLGFGGFLAFGVPTQMLSVPFGLWWCELIVFFGLPYVALQLSTREPLKALGLRRPWAAGAVFGFALGVVNFFAVVAPVQYLTQLITPKSLLEVYDAAQVFRDKGPFELAAIIAGVCIAAPLCEETFFRGLVQPGLNEKLSAPLAIITTGWIFSFFHLDPIGFMARWELGAVFGLLAWRTGSLWPGIFMHLANNLTSTVLYFVAKSQGVDETSDDPRIVAGIAGIGGLALLFVVLMARRFPQALQAPQRAEEERVTVNATRAVLPWVVGGVLSLAALLVFDFRGSMVRAIDTALPVRHPTAAIQAAREDAIHGEMSFSDYAKVRRTPAVTDAGVPPQ
jgi:membrane protease YdiL (CAAX protease family)